MRKGHTKIWESELINLVLFHRHEHDLLFHLVKSICVETKSREKIFGGVSSKTKTCTNLHANDCNEDGVACEQCPGNAPETSVVGDVGVDKHQGNERDPAEGGSKSVHVLVEVGTTASLHRNLSFIHESKNVEHFHEWKDKAKEEVDEHTDGWESGCFAEREQPLKRVKDTTVNGRLEVLRAPGASSRRPYQRAGIMKQSMKVKGRPQQMEAA